MKLKQLKHRIARAEAVLEGRERQVSVQWRSLRQIWRSAWTPTRIIIAGLGLGFVAGRSEPGAALGRIGSKLDAAPHFLKLISALSTLVTVDLADLMASFEAGQEAASGEAGATETASTGTEDSAH